MTGGRRRVPAVLQATQTECGLSCVVAMLGAYGHHARMPEFRAEVELGRDGMTVGDIVRLLRSRDMTARVLRAPSAEHLRLLDRPVILFWENNHFVVLERIVGDRAVIMDPARGRRRVSFAELAAGFSGLLIDAEPGEDFARRRVPAFADWRTIPLRAPGTLRALALAMLLIMAGYALTLSVPLLTQWSVDSLAGDAPEQFPILGAILIAMASYYVIAVLRTVVLSRIVALVGQHLMSEVFAKLLRLPMRFFASRAAGDLLFRIASAGAIRDFLSSRLVQSIIDIGTIVVLFVYLAALSLPVFLLTAGVLVLIAVLLATTQPAIVRAVDNEVSHAAKAQAIQLDAIFSVPAVKMAGAQDWFAQRWRGEYAASLRAMRRTMVLQQGWIGGVVSSVQIFAPLLLLFFALSLVQTGSLTLGAAVSVQGMVGMLFGVATSIFQSFAEFVHTSRAATRVADITESDDEPEGGDVRVLDRTDIRLENVSYSYAANSAPVLTDLSVTAPAGAVTAIVGPSGAGKTTLAMLMCSLSIPSDGEILFGGRPLADYHLSSLRQQIGYVPQDVALQNGTLADNLMLGAGDGLSIEEVEMRCRTFGILDFVDDLPMGYATQISNQGGSFSGGQRQRIAVARALLRDPQILVLDEATSALDTVNEDRVRRLLQSRGCTQIILAHRLSTIRGADQIIVLDRGRIAQRGTHEELMSLPGLYRDLYASDDVLGAGIA